MPAHKKVSARQAEILLSFMESNIDIAKGRVSHEGGPLGKQNMLNKWGQLADSLNAVGDGVTKSYKEWRVYWNNMKYKVRSKAAQRKSHMRGTGGGPAWDKGDLSDEEWRILNILGKECVYGDEAVRIPFQELENEDANIEVAVPLLLPPASPLPPSPTPPSQSPPPCAPLISEPGPSSAQIPPPRRPYVRHPIPTPDVPEWARQTEARNTAALESIGEALQGIYRILDDRLPHFRVEFQE